MTESLQRAFNAAAQLSEADQDSIARWLLAEMKSERKWSELFADSQDMLGKLASEALAEHLRGETRDLNMN